MATNQSPVFFMPEIDTTKDCPECGVRFEPCYFDGTTSWFYRTHCTDCSTRHDNARAGYKRTRFWRWLDNLKWPWGK